MASELSIPKTKVCTKCGKRKKMEFFLKSKNGKFGHRADCKRCNADDLKARRVADPEKFKKYDKTKRQRHYPAIRARQKIWESVNRDKTRATVNRYRARHVEKVSAKNKAWSESNPTYRKNRKAQLREELAPEYIASMMGVRLHEVPPALIEAKQIHLKIKRYLKERTQ